jgi:hypothetical protein
LEKENGMSEKTLEEKGEMVERAACRAGKHRNVWLVAWDQLQKGAEIRLFWRNEDAREYAKATGGTVQGTITIVGTQSGYVEVKATVPAPCASADEALKADALAKLSDGEKKLLGLDG